MCVPHDALPPVPRLSGGSIAHRDLELTSDDGTRFAAFEATSGTGGPAVVVLPDVRGLFRFYEELALRFADRGTDAVAIDYFGRTAGVEKRPADWDFWPHVEATTLAGLRSDAAAAIQHLRTEDTARDVVVVGFCFGGSNAWHLAASGLGVAAAVGFYGHPDRPDFPTGAPSVLSELVDVDCPILALQGGADPGIPPDVNQAFREAMEALDVVGDVFEYEGAPHSFFDRRFEEFADASADAWTKTVDFIDTHTAP